MNIFLPLNQLKFLTMELVKMQTETTELKKQLQSLKTSVPIIKTDSPLSTDSGVISASPRLPMQDNTVMMPEPGAIMPNNTISLKYGCIVRAAKQHDNSRMVPIGSGKTKVPKAVLNNINWKSYTTATRKLLTSVFSRNILATHTLTGKPSPAFKNKPTKLCLDARKVADIIMIVSEKCNVRENLIRNVITTKCADESRRMRLKTNKL